jgi:hypothetical protein
MNRQQLQHVLRAAVEIAADPEPLVIGSQAVLGTHDASELPVEATRSIEADIAFLNDADETKADRIDGAIGELSRFHETFGYYAQGVSVTTATLPAGWEVRVIRVPIDGTNVEARCLELHDCVVSKLVADRPKDREFAAALLRAGLADADVLVERVRLLPGSVSEQRRRSIEEWIRRQT